MATKTSGGTTTSIINLFSHLPPAAETMGGNTTSYDAVDYLLTEGVSLPQYFQRLRRGDLLPYTPFRQFSRKGSMTSQTYNVQTTTYANNGSSRTRWAPKAPGFQTWMEISESELQQRMTDQKINLAYYTQAAAARIYQKGRFDALTFLSELHKVIAMFMSVGEKLLNLLHLKPPGVPWNLWLEGRYGWRTLLFDFQNLENALASLNDKRRRHSERVGNRFSITETSVSTSSDTACNFTWYNTDVWTFEVRGTVCADLDLPRFQFNPIITAWELLKFSFVIDWFLSVGQSLAALSFVAFTMGDYAACTGYKVTLNRIKTATATPKAGYIINSFSRSSDVTASLERRAPVSLSLLPQFRLNVNELKILDLLALIVQAYRRG